MRSIHPFKRTTIITATFVLGACAATNSSTATDDEAGEASDSFAGFEAQELTESGSAAPYTGPSLLVGDIATATLSARLYTTYRIVIAAGSTLQIDAASANGKPTLGVFGRITTSVPTRALTSVTAASGTTSVSLTRRFANAGVYHIRLANASRSAQSAFTLTVRCAGGGCNIACGEGAECPGPSRCGASSLCSAGTRSARACTADTECGANGFCRAGLCHARQLEGQRCGGHTPIEYQELCSGNLSCVEANPGIADAPGLCAIEVSAADLARNAGRLVSVVNTVTDVAGAGCTRNLCGPTNPCCNRCNASIVLTSGASQIQLASETGGDFATICSGTNCSYRENCGGLEPGKRVRVLGRFDATSGRLRVTSIYPERN